MTTLKGDGWEVRQKRLAELDGRIRELHKERRKYLSQLRSVEMTIDALELEESALLNPHVSAAATEAAERLEADGD